DELFPLRAGFVPFAAGREPTRAKHAVVKRLALSSETLKLALAQIALESEEDADQTGDEDAETEGRNQEYTARARERGIRRQVDRERSLIQDDHVERQPDDQENEEKFVDAIYHGMLVRAFWQTSLEFSTLPLSCSGD